MDAKQLVYDREADVLYLWGTDPAEIENIITEETGDEILVKKNADTGETIGVTVLHFHSRDDSIEGISLPTTPQTA